MDVKWLSFVGVIPPALAGVVALLRIRDQLGITRRIRLHARLRSSLKGSVRALEALDVLLEEEAEALSERERYLLRRKLDGVRLGLSIFCVLLSIAVAIPLTQWVVSTWGTWWVVLSGAVSVVAAILLVTVTAVGFSEVYSDPEAAKS